MRFAFTLTFLHVLLVSLAGASAEPSQIEADVDRLARQFRLRTYQVFRHNRPEYDRRLAWVERELTKQRADGFTQQEVDRLRRWIDAVESTPPYPGAALPDYDAQTIAVIPRKVFPVAPSSPSVSEIQPSPATVTHPEISIERVPPSVDLREKHPVTLDDDVSVQRLRVRESLRLPTRSTPSREVASHRWRVPQVVTNQESLSSGSSETTTPPRRSVQPTVDVRADLPTVEAGPVNLTVLRAKIRSYNLSRSALENELLEDPFSDSETMELVVQQLGNLLNDYRLVNLYYGSLSTSAQARLEAPVEIASLLQLAEARCRELQRGDVHRSQESERLATLVHRIQELTFDFHSDRELP